MHISFCRLGSEVIIQDNKIYMSSCTQVTDTLQDIQEKLQIVELQEEVFGLTKQGRDEIIRLNLLIKKLKQF